MGRLRARLLSLPGLSDTLDDGPGTLRRPILGPAKRLPVPPLVREPSGSFPRTKREVDNPSISIHEPPVAGISPLELHRLKARLAASSQVEVRLTGAVSVAVELPRAGPIPRLDQVCCEHVVNLDGQCVPTSRHRPIASSARHQLERNAAVLPALAPLSPDRTARRGKAMVLHSPPAGAVSSIGGKA